MAKVHPLDLRIEIAELFDSGVFTGTTPLDEIVAQSRAASSQGARSAILALGFTKVKSRTKKMKPIPARWEPPRKLPDLSGRHSALTHAVRELFISGAAKGRCYASELPHLADASDESARRVLKSLRFKVVKQAYKKHVGWESETWRPPRNWPALFVRQRTLRRNGLSANAIIGLTDAAAGVEAILRDASTNLLLQGIPVDQRGRMRREVKRVIQEMFAQDRQTVAVAELAAKLGMKTTSGPDRLLAEVDNLRTPDPAEQKAYNEIARMSDDQMRQCVRILARQSSRQDAMGPAAYALRWVRENHAVA